MATDEVAPTAWREPPAQSKRDRKRQQLTEKLASLTEKFNRDRDLTYRDQLQKVQIDVNLVQRLDPYAPEALTHIAQLREDHQQAQPQDGNAVDTARTILGMAGPKFLEYLQTVEDAVEYRDFHLTRAMDDHRRKLAVYENTREYKVETARREHRALCSTIRDRLINTLNSKKYRLSKEKEALEISDSSALLLHPNQFSITNPASPGGTHSKRATRLRKDADEIPNFADGKKRKRNPLDDDGSPAPARRALDPNSTTPLWQSEKSRVAAKQNGPIYSIDKLFTDKELSMTYNTAALAARKYILRTRVNGAVSSPNDSDSGDHENEEGSESWPSAPMMERQISHATRSTRGGANQNVIDEKVLGLEGIANFELPSNLDLLHSQEPPKMPPPVPQQYMKPYPRTGDQNFPTSLSSDDINNDLAVMNMFRQYDQQQHKRGACIETPALRRVLKIASIPYAERRFVALTQAHREDPEHLRGDLGLPVSSMRDQTPPPTLQGVPGSGSGNQGGVAMSRTSSLGGAAMSRQGSSRGKGRKN